MRAWMGAVVSAVLVCTTLARANVSSRLIYARRGAAETCPSESSLRKAVAERLGYDPFVAWAPQTVVVRLLGQSGRLRAEIDLVDPKGIATGSRAIAGREGQCEELLRSAALTLSIMLDPMNVDRPSPPAETQKPALDEATAPAPSTTTSTAPSVAERSETIVASTRKDAAPAFTSDPRDLRSDAIGFYAGPLLLLGTAPKATMGVRLGFDFSDGPWGGFVEARGDAASGGRASGGGAVHSAFLGGAFGPCLFYFGLRGCGVVLLGASPSWATDVEGAHDETPLYAALGARLQKRWSLSERLGLGVMVNADGMKTLTRNQLRLRQIEVWRAPAFAAAFGIGVDIRFP